VANSPTATADATLANVTSSATSVTVFAANARARRRIVYNDSSATLYLKFGTGAASTTSFTVVMATNTMYEFPGTPVYAGVVTGIWASANGFARTTEY
jgi:hypothetical protein